MPRYNYRCTACEYSTIVRHGMNEVYEDCENCPELGTMEKVLSVPINIKKETTTALKKVGELTKEYIEANRQLLNDEKERLKRKKHEST